MSNLPHFIADQQENAFWELNLKRNQEKLEKRIRFLLKNESLAVRYTYGYLRYVDKDQRGFAYPAQATIAKAVKVSPRHVIRCLARLEELQLIQRGKKGGHSYYIFTVPNAFIQTKSPLEERIKEITQEVKELKERALRHHLSNKEKTVDVSRSCHTNKEKIIKKIKEPRFTPSKESSLSCTKRQIPASTQKPNPTKDWYAWIEEKKSIILSKKEKEDLQKRKNQILSQRQKRFKNFPQTFLETYTQELALTSFLAENKQILYKGPPCELLKEINL